MTTRLREVLPAKGGCDLTLLSVVGRNPVDGVAHHLWWGMKVIDAIRSTGYHIIMRIEDAGPASSTREPTRKRVGYRMDRTVNTESCRTLQTVRLYCLLVTPFILGAGCFASYEIRKLSSSSSEEQAVLFGAYKFDVTGVADGHSETFNISCELSFLSDVDIATPFDSIPIIVLDSICFAGNCINRDIWYKLLSYDDWSRVTDWEKLGVAHKRWEPRANPDLSWDERHIFPLSYEVGCDVIIPVSCQEGSLTARIAARLCDRVTKREIARESKLVPVWIKKDRSYYPD